MTTAMLVSYASTGDWTAVISAVAVIFGLAGSGGALWAVFRASALEASNERLRKENEDYVRRLNYIEPKVETLERENETLHKLYNPSEAIVAISTQVGALLEQEKANHTETIGLLREVAEAIKKRTP